MKTKQEKCFYITQIGSNDYQIIDHNGAVRSHADEMNTAIAADVLEMEGYREIDPIEVTDRLWWWVLYCVLVVLGLALFRALHIIEYP